MFICNPWTGSSWIYTNCHHHLGKHHAGVAHLLTTCEKRQPTQLPSGPPNCSHSSWWLNHNNFRLIGATFASNRFAVMQFCSSLSFHKSPQSCSSSFLYMSCTFKLCYS
jgi:hypothetical protein